MCSVKRVPKANIKNVLGARYFHRCLHVCVKFQVCDRAYLFSLYTLYQNKL